MQKWNFPPNIFKTTILLKQLSFIKAKLNRIRYILQHTVPLLLVDSVVKETKSLPNFETLTEYMEGNAIAKTRESKEVASTCHFSSMLH